MSSKSSNGNAKLESENSFYRLGGIEILSVEQDERSLLWKFYLSTTEHYVVSREFDRTHGMYANAPEDVMRKGLMDFSASIVGKPLSIFAIMDMFIERCFSDDVFDSYTENAAWMSLDFPSYEEMEDILTTYSSRILWVQGTDDKNDYCKELMNRFLFKMPNTPGEKSKLIGELIAEFKRLKIRSMFLNSDHITETVLKDRAFEDFPTFKGVFSNDGETFNSFKFMSR